MEFSADFLSNRVYSEQALMFDSILPAGFVQPEGEKDSLETGALVQPNGDILFRIYAPGVQEVVASVIGVHGAKRDCVLIKNGDGMFKGLYPYDPTYCGPHIVDILFDGTVALSPYLPISWNCNRPVNCIEVPDPETGYINILHVPHGAVTQEIYWSKEFGWQRCMVYTPPGYQKCGEAYPVLYLLHGGGENETCWVYKGRVAHIMDNLLAEGKCVPFIIVMPYGMVAKPGDVTKQSRSYAGYERSLLDSCIPFIEDTYRVKTDKWDRAIGGCTMGSAQAFIFGLKNPDLFGAIAFMSGQYSREGTDDEWSQKALDPEYVRKNYKIFFRTIGDAEPRYQKFLAETKICEERGIASLPCYHEAIYRYQTHDWGSWRRAFYDYARMLFR